MKMKKLFTSLFILVAAFALIGNIYSQCPSGLVSYWKMDETSGTTLTDVQSGRDATRNSSAGNVSGEVDNSQRFTYSVNGGNDAYTSSEYASVTNSSAFNFGHNSSFTISYWVKFRDCGVGFQDHIAISKGNWDNGGGLAEGMFASGLNGSCKINFLLRDDTGYKIDMEKNLVFDTETWHHVACVRDDSQNKNILYVDGAVMQEVVWDYAGGFSSDENLEFGNLVNNGSHGYFLRGDLDEVAIFDKALSSTEIDQIITDASSNKGICTGTTAPNITSTAITTGLVGEAYSYDVNATGNPSAMTFSLVSNPPSMTIDATTGVISWTPAATGIVPVEVKADNGIAPAATQSFSITVTGLNPTITSTPITSAMVGEAYTYDVNATGTPTGMTYSLRIPPAGMTINPSTGVISWTPSASGDVTVRVKADNSIAPADSQIFTISVALNNPHITSTPILTAFVGTPYTYTVYATGMQTGMTYSVPVNAPGMTIDETSGVISWTPLVAGDIPVRVKAANGIAPADSQSFIVAVAAVSYCPDDIISLHRLDESSGPEYVDFYGEHNATASVAPVATTGIIGGAQLFNGTTKLDIPDRVTEFDWLASRSFSIECWIKTSTTGEMVCVGRNRTDYVAARWFLGTNSSGKATFELRDNGGPNVVISGTTNVADNTWHHILAVRDGSANLNKLYVDGVEEASVSKTYVFSFKADNSLDITVGYMNVSSGDELHFIGSIDEVAIFNRAVSSTEVATFYNNGIPSGHCKGSNNPPVIETSPPSYSINEESNYHYDITVNDPDALDVLTITAPVKPSWLNFSFTPGQKNATLSGSAPLNYVGEDDIVIRVTDGEWTRDQIFRLAVLNVNDAPVKTSVPLTSVNVNTLYSYTLTVTDVDENAQIAMIAVSKPDWLTFTHAAHAKTATLSGTPTNANVGATPIDISISDGIATIHEIYTLTVVNTNAAPVITGQSAISVNEDQSITILKSSLTIVDPDNAQGDLTIAVEAGTNYTFSGNTVTPAANFNGPLSVNVKAHDLLASSAAYPVIVTVNPVNDPPVKTTTPITTVEVGTAYSYTLTVTDADATDVISMTAIKPSWLTFTYTPGAKTATLAGTPAIGNLGANQVDISISDGTATIHELYTLTVTVSNDRPVITGQKTLSVNEDQGILILKSDLTIVDHNNLLGDITIIVQPGTNYTFVGNSVTPAANFNGQLSVNVIARDLSENSDVYPVVVTVNPVNDMPVITSKPGLTASIGKMYLYTLTVTDEDEADQITMSSLTRPSWLTFTHIPGAKTATLAGIPGSANLGLNNVDNLIYDGTVSIHETFIITVNNGTAIDQVKDNEFVIYPVPVNDELNIKFNIISEETVVDIINSTGSVVESIIVPANTDITSIPMGQFEAGFYICHIKNNTINATSRFTIVR
jgi:hypothetical protein